ncbi:MAG: N-acetylmuramoyl-L-alanine amidase [Flavobacteriales bacterium]|nr:N-acetylmuramoyl-L-alanine amidase [Flavobacteriales bacterium]
MNMHCAKLPILREFKKNDFLLKLLVLLVVLFTCSKSFPLYSQQIKTVVIDAGHGGKDPGCHGNFAFEKEVCLSMALKLGSLIKAKYPEIKIIYTRDKDVFVELIERANIANRAKADLFICIHANAEQTKAAFGTETYVLGLHRTEAQQRVAERENSIIALEDDKGAKYKEIDLSTDAIIVRQLQLKVFLDHSILFAEKLQKAFKKFGRYDRGVKQAGFLVLYKTTMPSVLIETGFLTNPNEEKFLGNITGQVNMADLMFNAFENYRNQIENKTPVIIEKNDEIISEPVESPESTLKDSSGLVFRVQVETWDKRRDNSYNLFKGYEVFEYEQDKMYKYCIGNFSDYQMAKNYKIELIKKGFQNAFLVAFLNGERISIEKAIKLAEK